MNYLPANTSITGASYNVIPYPYENRNVGTIAVETNPWLKAGANNKATNYGWHFDGTTDYNLTRGNNVYAYDDSANLNMPISSPISSTASPTLKFEFTPNFSQTPYYFLNRNFSTVNVFYWNNTMHDLFYQYGFDEMAGNFQNNNLGRGGLGGDFVRAEVLDGGGINNANFRTLPDGDTAKMQMYVFKSLLKLNSPYSVEFNAVEGGFSNANQLSRIGAKTGILVLYNDDILGNSNKACNPPTNNLTGKIALIYRGTCTFVSKVKNAQDAGAIGVIMVDSILNEEPFAMGGTDNSIIIPAVMISKQDGDSLKKHITENLNVSLGLQIDGALDNGVVTHEYGHGISIRLTGGPSTSKCLFIYEQAGEGWSDYIALMATTNWGKAKITDFNVARPIGTYVENQTISNKGSRTYRYSTDMKINPLTYSNISDTINHPLRDQSGKIIQNATEFHYIGEVWCSALWDMTWLIIQKTGKINPNLFDTSFGGGNSIALNLVMQGLKMQKCQPGFLDSRDAILLADSLLYDNKFHCEIWSAFARRGMGFSANQGSSNNTTDQVPAFDLPPNQVPTITPVGLINLCEGNSVTFNSNISNNIQWRKDSTIINSATLGSYTANAGGVYFVEKLNKSGCSSFSNGSKVVINPLPAKPTINWSGTEFSTNSTNVTYQWYLKNVAVPGAVNKNLTPTSTGTYKIQITDNNDCKNVSDSFNLVVTSINNPASTPFSNIAKLIPNPSSTEVLVKFQQAPSLKLNLQIFDSKGQLVKEVVTNSQTTIILLNRIESGNYYLKIIGKNYNQTQQLIVIK